MCPPLASLRFIPKASYFSFAFRRLAWAGNNTSFSSPPYTLPGSAVRGKEEGKGGNAEGEEAASGRGENTLSFSIALGGGIEQEDRKKEVRSSQADSFRAGGRGKFEEHASFLENSVLQAYSSLLNFPLFPLT